MKKILIVILSIVLVGCSTKVEQKKDTTLKGSIEWKEDNKNIDKYKEYHLAAYPDITIGDALNSRENVKWKYGKDKKESYLMCSFKEDKDKYIVIFYKDSYDNVNIAEYYINNKKASKKKKEEFETNHFVKKEEQPTNQTDNQTVSQTQPVHTTSQTDSLKGAFDANHMPSDGNYYNSPDGGWPHTCMIKINKTSPNSFRFSIWRIYDENGERCNELIFNEHEAIFEEVDSRSAIYRGKNYTLYFFCDYYYSFNLSGFEPAQKAGDLYSSEEAGSENFGV